MHMARADRRLWRLCICWAASVIVIVGAFIGIFSNCPAPGDLVQLPQPVQHGEGPAQILGDVKSGGDASPADGQLRRPDERGEGGGMLGRRLIYNWRFQGIFSNCPAPGDLVQLPQPVRERSRRPAGTVRLHSSLCAQSQVVKIWAIQIGAEKV